MDRHDLPGLSAEGVASAHEMDLGVQNDFGCNAMTYWVDEDRGYVFCLIEAPDIQVVKDMHSTSHGLIPHEIKEVNSELVQAFLGRILDPEPAVSGDSSQTLIITETAYRAILSICLKDTKLFRSLYGPEVSTYILNTFHEKVRQYAEEYQGLIVENRNDHLLSFLSVSNALDCGFSLLDFFTNSNINSAFPGVQIQLGLSAGIPVTENRNLFGDAISTAELLNLLSGKGNINISANIRELYKGKYPERLHTMSGIRIFNSEEEAFLLRLMECIRESISFHEFKLEEFCKKLGLSKSTLYRKVVSLSGLSPIELMMEIRLKQSLDMLQSHNLNVSQTSYELGFANSSYFSKCFKKRFGILPADFLKSVV